jgi:hypothetical protein
MRSLGILASQVPYLTPEMPALFGRKIETHQFDEELVQRVLQPDDDIFDIFSGICHLHGLIEFHVSPSVAYRTVARKRTQI